MTKQYNKVLPIDSAGIMLTFGDDDIVDSILTAHGEKKIGVNSTKNWGELTASEAGKGLYWFENIKQLKYSNVLEFIDIGIDVQNSIYFSNYNPVGNFDLSDSPKLVQAITDAYTVGKTLYLPEGEFLLAYQVTNLSRIVGVKGKTTIKIDNTNVFNNMVFCNKNFKLDKDSTADSIYVEGINFIIDLWKATSIMRFANIKELTIRDCRFETISNENPLYGSGVWHKSDALIDLHASVENAQIYNNYFANTTGAVGRVALINGSISGTTLTVNNVTTGTLKVGVRIYAIGIVAGTLITAGSDSTWTVSVSQTLPSVEMYITNPLKDGGGGAIWVRNHTDSSDKTKATQNIKIFNNDFYHYTSDESLAVYCVMGVVNDVRVYKNKFVGLPIDPTNVVYHKTLFSAFVLQNSANTALYDVTFEDNDVYDASWYYYIMRFGLISDTTALCVRLTSINNKIYPTYELAATANSPRATWLLYGSEGSDPDTVNIAFYAVQNAAATYAGFSNAAFVSINDTVSVVSGKGTVLVGLAGFDRVINPTANGSLFYALENNTVTEGGNLEAYQGCWHNCQNIQGGRGRNKSSDLTTALVIVDKPSGQFSANNILGATVSNVLYVHSSATNSTYVKLINANVTKSNASAYCVRNESATAYVVSRLNIITGSMAGGTTGTVESSLNRYGTTVD